MRQSQIAVASAFACFVLLIAGAVIAARVILAQVASEDYATAPAGQQGADLASAVADLTGFDSVDARGVWEITLQQGADWDVRLTYPDEMADRLRVRVEGDRLVLDYDRQFSFWRDRSFDSHGHVQATIVMPELAAIHLAGASELSLDGFTGDTLAITTSGATEIDGTDSRFANLDLTVSGAGDVNLSEMLVDNARVILSGAGDVDLNMNGGELTGSVAGAGDLTYSGTVSRQDVAVSGFSSVEARD
jgi:Putative auto-transporter adhesin, head GIN domain